jgi:hypothetical protein
VVKPTSKMASAATWPMRTDETMSASTRKVMLPAQPTAWVRRKR